MGIDKLKFLRKHRVFPMDKKKFIKYFHQNGWTLKLYEQAVNSALSRNFHDLRQNTVYPKERSLRRYLENGRIPLEGAIDLCKFFDCMPSDLGINVNQNLNKRKV